SRPRFSFRASSDVFYKCQCLFPLLHRPTFERSVREKLHYRDEFLVPFFYLFARLHLGGSMTGEYCSTVLTHDIRVDGSTLTKYRWCANRH
ncbi:hypothetical protein BT96DRAFT_1105997, partial [Gymnopus androsaceus JB14]